ncbi:MAG: type II secretion system F family protein, partial [Planctomycetota bacterium]
IIPKFKDIFDSLSIELPKPTRILLATSDWMQNNAPLWVAGMIGIVIGMRLYGKTPTGRKQIDWLKLRIPVFGPLFRKVAIARFARTFATLIQSGVPILGALEIVAATSGNRIIEDAVLDASSSVRQGETLAAPLAKSAVFPAMESAVDSLTSLIEPLMIAVMGVVVGGMVLAIFLPIFKIAGSLS